MIEAISTSRIPSSAGGYDRAECLKYVETYDPALNVWQRMAPMKEARGRFSVAVVNGQAYAVAGSNGTTELATVERYDPVLGKWCRVTSLPLARCNTGKWRVGRTARARPPDPVFRSDRMLGGSGFANLVFGFW